MRRIVSRIVVPRFVVLCILVSVLAAALVFLRGSQGHPASGAHFVVHRFPRMLGDPTAKLVTTPTTTPDTATHTRLSDGPRPIFGSPESTSLHPNTLLGPVATGEQCQAEFFLGIRHCWLGEFEILRIDPVAPFLHIRTVFPLGLNRHGAYHECDDLLPPDNVTVGTSEGPGCHVQGHYPGELLFHMAARYPRAAAASNGDFFSPSYAHGAMALTVREGTRLDGAPQDHDQREVQRSSLSISAGGDVRIGVVPRQSLPDPSQPWDWAPNPFDFCTTVGGLPQLVQDGEVVDIRRQCKLEEGWCADPFRERARTAVGSTPQGLLFIVVLPEDAGVRLQALAERMRELGAWDALNLDGGGWSQWWYQGKYLVYLPRPLAQALIVEAITSEAWNQLATAPLP